MHYLRTILIASILFLIPYGLIAYPLQHLLFRRIAPDLTQWYILFVIGGIYIMKTIFGIAYRVFFAEHRAQWAYIYQALSLMPGKRGLVRNGIQ